MSHDPALTIEAVTVSTTAEPPVAALISGGGDANGGPLLLDHLHKQGSLSQLSPGQDCPPPSCSRKLRKYSFLILLNKYILYAVNCLIWLGGLFLVAFGVWARVEDSTVGYLQLLPFDPVALLIALGSLSVVISFFGCIGSIRENVLFLKIFCGAIGCLFVVELASCIVGFVSVNSIKDAVIAKFYTSMELYDDDDQIRGLVDRIQKDYQCCGAVGPNDWDRNVYYNCSGNFNLAGSSTGGAARTALLVALNYMNVLPSACGVPSSCCRSAPVPVQVLASASSVGQINVINMRSPPYSPINSNPIASFPGVPVNDQCGYGIRRLQTSEQSSEIFVAGCADHMTESLSQNLLYVAVVALAISCFELISILLAFMLIRRVTTVIEFMAYIRSGRFIEVDPSRLRGPNGATPRNLQHLPLQIVITNEQHRPNNHDSRPRNLLNRGPGGGGGHRSRSGGENNNKERRKQGGRRSSSQSNGSSQNGGSGGSASNGHVPVESLRDIHI